MYISLILNVSLILALVTLYSLVLRINFQEKRTGKIVAGLVFGLTAVVAMSVAFKYGGGVIYDGRSIIISLAGLYGGFWAALLASLIASAYRIYLGGNGMWAGLATIIFCAITGLVFRKIYKAKTEELRLHQFYLFGVVVHLVMLACQLLIIPWPAGVSVIERIWLPILLIFPLATALAGSLLQGESKRITAENKLKESEEKYRILFDNAGQMILVAQDGVFKLVNKKALDYGYKEEEIIGKPFIDFIHPEDRQLVYERHQKRLKDENFAPTYQFRFITKDGNLRWVEITAVKIDWEGRPATLNYVSDITERVKAEQEREALLRVIENSQNEIYIFDPVTLRFSYANRAALENTGYSQEELIGLTPLDLKPEFDREKFLALIEPLLEGKKNKLIFETIHLRKDGSTYPVEVHLHLVDLPSVKSFLAIILDITERRTAASRLEKTLQGIIRATARMVEVRDPYTAGHQERVAKLAEAIAREMGLDEFRIQAISFASIIHDLGKIAVPPEILNKPGKLSEIEMELIKTHVQVGYDILKDIEFPWPVAEIVYEHHEKIDGSGYPRGLKDGKILLEARIICVADTIEAISSNRPYRPALGMEVALKEIRENAGKLYDPQVVEACLNLIEKKGFSFDLNRDTL